MACCNTCFEISLGIKSPDLGQQKNDSVVTDLGQNIGVIIIFIKDIMTFFRGYQMATPGVIAFKAAQGDSPSQWAIEMSEHKSQDDEVLASEFLLFIEFLDDEVGSGERRRLMAEFDRWLRKLV